VSKARNGSWLVDGPYEARVVDEQPLLSLLNEGWNIVEGLRGGRIVVRRPNDRSTSMPKKERS